MFRQPCRRGPSFHPVSILFPGEIKPIGISPGECRWNYSLLRSGTRVRLPPSRKAGSSAVEQDVGPSAPAGEPTMFHHSRRRGRRPSSFSWLPPRLILLFRSKINAASNSKCKQIRENLLRAGAAANAGRTPLQDVFPMGGSSCQSLSLRRAGAPHPSLRCGSKATPAL